MPTGPADTERDLLADALLPEFDVESTHAEWINAPARDTYAAARNLDLSGSAVVRWLFRLRGLPPSALTLDGLTTLRFKPLREDPPRGFALGLVGQFWRPSGRLLDFEPGDFTTLHRPGFAKAIWTFRVFAGADSRSFLRTWTRVRCMDEAARRKFLRYWRFVGPFSGLIRTKGLRLIREAAEGVSPSPQPEPTSWPEGGVR